MVDAETHHQYDIVLETDAAILDEVVVSARRSLMELKDDRLVLNVGSVPTFQGDNALQILQKSPGVLVLENNNSISLNGNGEVLIMINNRISRIPRDVLIAQLKGMQAENIERIEIIHQPSVKYDSDNTGGIIHIVMKKNNLEGFNGNANIGLGYGQNEKANGSLNWNWRKRNFNFYGNLTGNHAVSPNMNMDHFREYEYEGDIYYAANYFRATPHRNALNINAGMDLEFSNTVVGAQFGLSVSSEIVNNGRSNSIFIINGLQSDATSYRSEWDNPKDNIFINLNVNHKLNSNSKVNFDLDRIELNVQNKSILTNKNSSDSETFNPDRTSNFAIYTIKGDYEYRSTNQTKFQLGIKYSNNQSHAQADISRNTTGELEFLDGFRRNDNMKEKIISAYSSMQKDLNKRWSGELGIRFESFNFDLKAQNERDNFNAQFNNFFPVLRINFKIDSTKSIQLFYNRRTQRANYFLISGFYTLLDPTLFGTSNTNLRPAFFNSININYSHNRVLTSLSFSRITGAINFYNTVDKANHIQNVIPINFDQMDRISLTTNFPVYVKKWWEMFWTLSGSFSSVRDESNRPVPFYESLYNTAIQGNNTFTLGKKWTANFSGRYQSPLLGGDQIKSPRPVINFGIRKTFTNGSALGFNIQDITQTSGVIDWEYHQPELGIRTFGHNDWSERVFRINYTFNFGNEQLKSKRNRQTGSQEERNRM